MTTTRTPTRTALLDLHRALLDTQRVQVERLHGRMTGTEVLQAAADDLRFAWLRPLSELVAALDAAQAEGDRAGEDAQLDRARALIDPPDDETPFGRRYLLALQDDPAVVLAHAAARASLA